MLTLLTDYFWILAAIIFWLFIRGLFIGSGSGSTEFRYRKKNGYWRAYFRGAPPSRSHVLHDSDGSYVCWSTPLTTRAEAERVASLWQERYGNGAGHRSSKHLLAPTVITTLVFLAVQYLFQPFSASDSRGSYIDNEPYIHQADPPLVSGYTESEKAPMERPSATSDIHVAHDGTETSTERIRHNNTTNLKKLPKEQAKKSQDLRTKNEGNAITVRPGFPSSSNRQGKTAGKLHSPARLHKQAAVNPVSLMTSKDRNSLNYCFETSKSHQPYSWVNPFTGISYRVVLKSTWYAGNRPCRKAEIHGVKKGRANSSLLVACRDNYGSWRHQFMY